MEFQGGNSNVKRTRKSTKCLEMASKGAPNLCWKSFVLSFLGPWLKGSLNLSISAWGLIPFTRIWFFAFSTEVVSLHDPVQRHVSKVQRSKLSQFAVQTPCWPCDAAMAPGSCLRCGGIQPPRQRKVETGHTECTSAQNVRGDAHRFDKAPGRLQKLRNGPVAGCSCFTWFTVPVGVATCHWIWQVNCWCFLLMVPRLEHRKALSRHAGSWVSSMPGAPCMGQFLHKFLQFES